MHIVIDALGYIMGWCYSLVGNYGLAIIFFTFISKIVLLPLSVWVQLNSIKMIRMQPEINMLKVQYYGDKDRIYEEQEKIYKRDKYNPFLSVIPLVVQIFILIGLVSVIYHPLTYILHLAENIITELNMLAVRIKMLDPELSSIQLSVVDLVQSGACDKEILALGEKLGVDMAGVLSSINSLNMSFLGVNLSWVPVKTGGISLLVPLVAGLTSWLLCVAQNRSNVLQAEQSKFNQYSTMVLSVGISLYLGFFVPVGVVLYWIFSNLFAILQLYGLNFVINPRKYVDYEALELSRKKLEELELYGKEKKKGLFSKNIYAKREKEDYKRFFSIVNKHLVVYSEQSGYYKYFGDIVEYILKNTNITVHYVSSDPNDIAFEKAKEFKNLRPYYIGFNKFIVMAMKLDSDVVLMTMPDLDNFQIKRSYVRKDINYMYIAHGFGSRHLVMRTGAIDHFDTYFVEGKYQREEALKTEEKYGLNHKVIVDCGVPVIDQMRRQYSEMERVDDGKLKIFIAPSWQPHNIVDSCLEVILDSLSGKGYSITVRPHPQHVRHQPEKMERLKEKYSTVEGIDIQTDFSSNSTVFNADILITDWSGISFEYAFTTYRPIIFIDTPMKVMNPDYKELDLEPIEISARDIIGIRVPAENAEKVREAVEELIEKKDEYSNTIESFYHEYVYNEGNSAEVAGKYIIQTIQDKIKNRNKSA